MKKQSKSSSILASAMAMILALPGGAWAGGGRYDNGGHDNGYQKKGQYNSHYNAHYNTHYKNHYNNHYNNYYSNYTTTITGVASTIILLTMGTNRAAIIITITTTIIITTTICGLAFWVAASSVIPSAISTQATDQPSC